MLTHHLSSNQNLDRNLLSPSFKMFACIDLLMDLVSDLFLLLLLLLLLPVLPPEPPRALLLLSSLSQWLSSCSKSVLLPRTSPTWSSRGTPSTVPLPPETRASTRSTSR